MIRWLLLVWAGAALAIVLLMPGLRRSANGGTVHDFGRVEPRTRLSAEFAVRNTGPEAAYYSGFDRACGVSASMSGNRVLLSGQQACLRLSVNSGARRGPQAAAFALHRTRGRARETETYLLRWTLAGRPWLDSSEVWLPGTGQAGTSDVRAMDTAPGAVVRVLSVPDHVAASVIGGATIPMSLDESCDRIGLLGTMQVEVTSESDPWRHSVPVFAGRKVWSRLYPAVRNLPRQSLRRGSRAQLCRVVGDNAVITRVRCATPAFRATRERDGTVYLWPESDESLTGDVTVVLQDAGCREIARCTVYVGDDDEVR